MSEYAKILVRRCCLKEMDSEDIFLLCYLEGIRFSFFEEILECYGEKVLDSKKIREYLKNVWKWNKINIDEMSKEEIEEFIYQEFWRNFLWRISNYKVIIYSDFISDEELEKHGINLEEFVKVSDIVNSFEEVLKKNFGLEALEL